MRIINKTGDKFGNINFLFQYSKQNYKCKITQAALQDFNPANWMKSYFELFESCQDNIFSAIYEIIEQNFTDKVIILNTKNFILKASN